MGLTLDKIVPWGRLFEEYVSMFSLSEIDLKGQILGCGDGPAGFNATLTQRGGSVTSLDPLYAFNPTQIRDRIADTYDTVLTQMCTNQDSYVWDVIPSTKELGRIRMSAMEIFLIDFESGQKHGRYVAGSLPHLPFKEKSFDLGLASHFLFLYSEHLSVEFHVDSLLDMLRVAREVRIFPILSLDGKVSPHLRPVTEQLAKQGFNAELRRVAYEFQRGGNEMLVITPRKSAP